MNHCIIIAGFYDYPTWNERHLSWVDLRDLHNHASYPWVVIVDSNEILFSNEKEGRKARPNAMMQDFHNCLADCGLVDMGCVGDTFNWRRGDTTK